MRSLPRQMVSPRSMKEFLFPWKGLGNILCFYNFLSSFLHLELVLLEYVLLNFYDIFLSLWSFFMVLEGRYNIHFIIEFLLNFLQLNTSKSILMHFLFSFTIYWPFPNFTIHSAHLLSKKLSFCPYSLQNTIFALWKWTFSDMSGSVVY